MKILFLGNAYNPLSAACLQALVRDGHEVTVGVYNPIGGSTWRLLKKNLASRGWQFVTRKALQLLRCKLRLALRGLRFPLRSFASLPEVIQVHGTNALHCADPNGQAFLDSVRDLGCDLVVVAAFSRILKSPLMSIPRIGVINVHPSLLPLYRGPNPYYWVLANGEASTGVTVHYIDEGIDTGNVILQRSHTVGPEDTEITLQAKAAALASELLSEAVGMLGEGTAPSVKQDESRASYYSFPPKGASLL